MTKGQKESWAAGQQRFNEWVGTGMLDNVEINIKPIASLDENLKGDDRSYHLGTDFYDVQEC